jgi:hypothetical protein
MNDCERENRVKNAAKINMCDENRLLEAMQRCGSGLSFSQEHHGRAAG